MKKIEPDYQAQLDAQHKVLESVFALTNDLVKNEEATLKVFKNLGSTVRLLAKRVERLEKLMVKEEE